MKKTSTSTNRLLAAAGAALLCFGCAFTEYGNRINQEQLEIARLEDKRHGLETEFIGSAMDVTTPNTAACKPHREAMMVVVATIDLAGIRTGLG